MNRFFLLTLASGLVVVPWAISAQDGWVKWYGGEHNACLNSAQQTSDGGYILVGSREKYFYLVKTDLNGDTLWTKTYGQGVARSVEQTLDGGYVVVGYDGYDLRLLKTDTNGNTFWEKTYKDGHVRYGNCVQGIPDGGYIITGSFQIQSSYSADVYLLKTDAYGDTIWTRTYGGNNSDAGYCVKETSDKGYIIVGFTYSFTNGTESDIYLLMTDKNGDTLWTRKYGNYEEKHEGAWGRFVEPTSDGGYIIVGSQGFRQATADYDEYVYLLKINADGDTSWTRIYRFSEEAFDDGNCVKQTSDGGYIVAGTIFPSNHGGSDVYLIKTDENGDTLWTRSYGGPDDDHGVWVEQTSDSGYVIATSCRSFGLGDPGDHNNPGIFNFVLIKTDSLGRTPFEVSPSKKLLATYGGDSCRIIPRARFTNLGTEQSANNFYCHCEVIRQGDSILVYNDTVHVMELLEPWESIDVEFTKWLELDTVNWYNATFYATSVTGDSLPSRPMSIIFKWEIREEVSIEEKQSVADRTSSWVVLAAVGSRIVLSYANSPEGFSAAVFDATGRKVDELHSTQPEGIISWGEGFSPGVYFIVAESTTSMHTQKVILIR